MESKLRGPRTRAAIASLLADVDDDEDDATVAKSLGDEEDEELLVGISQRESEYNLKKVEWSRSMIMRTVMQQYGNNLCWEEIRIWQMVYLM